MAEFDPTIRAEVERIWREHLGVDPGATQAELTAQFDEEAQRLTELVLQRVGVGQGYLVRNWKAEHPGQDPDVMMTHQLIAKAEHDSREAVLAEELYSQVPEISEEQIARELEIEQRIEAEIAQRRQSRDPDRWRSGMVEVPDLARRVVRRVWPSEAMTFRTYAESLIAQKMEDNERTPLTAADPLADELAQMIDEQIKASKAAGNRVV
ncbi:hypothetical protein [Rhodococcus sp. T7]|uniref:hypothetical protein n=1 Tax=Rhodococcus sp. T7 TaxID=627444 RepID=UPI0013593BF8|nr:hypothetical protein [Rhodococcus sp. T7]KAF0966411.1 hypothetical protein MLGJGCBP_00430 [Rhodococcus sp. T7]